MALVDVESRVTPALTLQLKGASDLERRGRPARRALFGLMLSLATRAVEAQKTPSGSPPTMQAPKPDRPAESRPAPARATSVLVASGPAYHASPPPTELEQEFQRKQYKRDPKSGNYLAPKVFTKTLNEPLVQVRIGGRWMTDLKGQPVFLRESIRNKLLEADEAMFKKRQQHIVVNYGFRSNAVQQELFRRINGKGAVAPPGGSFHETGMALDINNWRDAQPFMIDAGFVGGCYGIEEDFVHYSIGEITKASNFDVFKRCTLKDIPKIVGKGVIAGGKGAGKGVKKGVDKIRGIFKREGKDK